MLHAVGQRLDRDVELLEDLLRLGCAAIGFTIYPGSALRNQTYEQLRALIVEGKRVGLPTVVWAYP
ncbi:MAG: hypothetical protein ACJ783_15770, partial [Myxococcales bacterium]